MHNPRLRLFSKRLLVIRNHSQSHGFNRGLLNSVGSIVVILSLSMLDNCSLKKMMSDNVGNRNKRLEIRING